MSGSADSVIRQIRSRVPLPVIWAVLSAGSIVCLRIIDPDTRPFDYAQNPVFIGVAFIASGVVPTRHVVWLPAVIAASVSLAVTLSWQAFS